MYGRTRLDQRQLHILGHIDEDRARAAGTSDLEGFGNHGSQLGRVGNQERVLGAGERHPQHINLLERIGANEFASNLARDGHHGDRVHHRVGEPRDQVGRSRA